MFNSLDPKEVKKVLDSIGSKEIKNAFELGEIKLKGLQKIFRYDSFTWRAIKWKPIKGELGWCLN